MSSPLQRTISKRYDVLLRLLLVGETGVGKTCLLCRYTHDEFVESHITTIGIDFKMKTLNIGGKTVKVQIWDTAGQERFESITKQFYRRAQGILLVYDITSRQSYNAIPKWLNYIHQFAQEDVCIMLVGNKSDREYQRMVTYNEAKKFASENSLMFYETSAKACDNLERAFYSLCQSVLSQTVQPIENDDSKSPKDRKKHKEKQNSSILTSDDSHRSEADTIQLLEGEEGDESSKKWSSCCSIS